MNFVKGFWSSTVKTSTNGNVQSQPNTIHGTQQANFNSVTFTTTTTATNGNSIIITTVPATPQNGQQITYQNNQLMKELGGVTQNFDQQQQSNGKVNLAFVGSTSEINNNSTHQHHNHHHNHHHHRNNMTSLQPHQQRQVVVREQYWSWNWPWQRWNAREKIFLIVIIVLSLCVLTLTSILSVVLQKNFQYKDNLQNLIKREQ